LNAPEKLRELVAPSDFDALIEMAERERIRRVRQAAQGGHDRPAEKVRDDRKENEGCEERDEDAAASSVRCVVDRVLRCEHGELEAAGLVELRSLQPAVLDAPDADARGNAGLKRKRRAKARAGDDATETRGDDPVVRPKAATQDREQSLVQGNVHGDAPENAAVVENGDRAHARRRTAGDADAHAGCGDRRVR